jgi:tripartite-type tricarboxylate transporter receptor subunit TctC
MKRFFRWPLLALLIAACGPANAQSWPDRPIKFISSQAAGNATDIIARVIAEQLSTRLGQPVIVENRPGGGNVIGTQAAARAAPDGYTLFFATAAALVTDPYTFKSLPYDPMKAFVPVGRVAEVSFMVVANPEVPAKSLNELIALAKKEPGKLSIATSGHRRFAGMIVSWINKLAGTNISQVPYTSMGPAIQDTIAGRIPLVILSVPEATASLSNGTLRALAVTSAQRLPDHPDVPTIAETFAGFDFTGWMLLAAPTGTPEPVIARINHELDGILKEPALLERLKRMHFSTPGAGTVQQTRDYVDGQHKAWGTLVKEIGVQPE